MVKILHCADLHLDSPFHALSPEKAFLRQKEQMETVRTIVELANDERVDLLVMAGDLFDGRDACYDTVLFLSNELKKARCKVFISPGNHDYFGANSPYQSVLWPENVHIFRSPCIERVELNEIVVYGSGFDTTYINRSVLQDFCVQPDEHAIMVLHGDTTTAGSLYNFISETDIAKSGLLYLALGHIHQFSGLKYAGKTAYAYSGCTEGRGFDEQGEKGVLLGEISREHVRLKFVPTAKRKYLEIQVPVSNAETNDDICLLIKYKIPQNAVSDILRVVLTGEAGFSIETNRIESEFEDKVFYISVRDKTTPKQNLWDSLGEDSLKGIFLERMKMRLDHAQTEEEREKILMAAEYGVASLSGANKNMLFGEAQ